MKKLLLFATFVFAAMTMNAQTAVTCAEAAAAMPAQSGSETDEVYIVTGYVTNTNGAISPSRTDASIDQQTFWMDDIRGTAKTLQGYWCNLPGHEALNVGDKITVTGKIMNYNNTAEIKNGDVVILERASVIIDTIPATACEAIAEGSALSNFDYSTDAFAVTGRLSTQDNVNNYGQHTFDLVCSDNGTIFGAYNCTCAESITLGIGDSVRIIGKLYNYNGKIEISNGTIELIEKNMRPTTAPAVPTHDEADVMAIYCNHYANNNANFIISGWAGSFETIDLNSTMVAFWKSMTWECLIDPVNVDVAHDFSSYENIHIDIWAPAASKIKFTAEAVASDNFKNGQILDLDEGWNSFDIAVAEWANNYDFSNLRCLVLENYQTPAGESFEGNPFAIANIYFWKESALNYEVTLLGITWGYISNYGNINGDWSGTLPANTQISIECDPDRYYPYCGRFEGWSDGVTSNYRSFYLTQDTTISAIVSGRESYQVSITAGEHGYLSNRYVGTRMQCQGDLSVEAYPYHGYRFAQWSDGVTDNPRTIELSQDTTITAEFEQYLYTNVKIGDLYYDLNFDDKTATVLGSSNGASDGASMVSVSDNSIAEWNELPQEYVFEANCPTDAAYLGLKSVKVYADQDYINILVEPDMNELPDLEWVPFQVFIDADNSDATGGYGDMYTDANSDIYCEGAVFAEGQPYSYNPAVYKWWGEVGGYGWEWTDPNVSHDASDYWGAIIGEGQRPVGNSQYVDGKFEIQLSRELLATAHPMNDTEFGIGFGIMQNWSSVGILPIASPTVDNPVGYAAKLKVRINKNAIPAEMSELELNPNLVIPSSVTYNDENYTVTTITREAFKNHTELTSVEIPTTMTNIYYNAFEGCDSITSVVWNAINCNTYRFGSQVESFVFGNEVEVIPDELCFGMHRLTSIVVPDGVTRIGYEAFANCSNLTHLYIPATVEEIGEHNLLWDMQLTHLTAPASVFAGYEGYDYYDINYYVTRYFSEYSPYLPNQLDTLVINRSELDAYSYGTIALSNKTLRHMDLGAIENTELKDEAFAHFYNLRSLVLPQDLEKINYMALASCKSLESITIPASVTEIGMSAFEDCRSLLSVNFEAGSMLTKISDWAFYNCHELQSIAIPEGVTEIGKAAFFDCVYLNDVIVPASVQAIGDNTFALCARMQQMRVKAAVPPSIASKTFEQVSREMPVYVPMNSVNAYKADPLWGEMNIIGVDEQWDAVDNITTSTVITKQLINGQLYIIRDGKTYTAQGQEVK